MKKQEISRDGDKSKAADRAPCSSVAGSICKKLSTAYQAFLRWFKSSCAVNITEGVVAITKADIASKISRPRSPEAKARRNQRRRMITSQARAKAEIAPEISRSTAPEVKRKRQRRPKVTSQTPAKIGVTPEMKRPSSPEVKRRMSRGVASPASTDAKTVVAPKISRPSPPEVKAKKRRMRRRASKS